MQGWISCINHLTSRGSATTDDHNPTLANCFLALDFPDEHPTVGWQDLVLHWLGIGQYAITGLIEMPLICDFHLFPDLIWNWK